LSEAPGSRTSLPLWPALVRALRLSGRAGDALAEASALVARFPRDCDSATLLAALRFERGESAAAHRLVDGALATANSQAPLPADLRCGLHAAAALQNAAAAATLLDRVTASEPVLRAFAEVVKGQSGTTWIDSRSYPWLLIARQPVVEAARGRLDASYTRERETARAALAGLP
jgi:hypothetical protein